MERSAIITKVRQKMDEVTAFDESIIDNVDLIDPSLDEAALKLLMVVPVHLVTPIRMDITSLTKMPPDYQTGYIKLPSDFLKLHTFKMKDWLRVVNVAIDEFHPKYKLQKNKFLRGGNAKPVVVIAWREPIDEASTSISGPGMQPDPNAPFKILEYYSVSDTNSHNVDYALYIDKRLPEEIAEEHLIDPLCWLCAGDVFTILNMLEQASTCFQHVQKYIKDNSFA